jgi:ribonuclease P protein component
MGEANFPKANHLLRKRDFDRVFARKCSAGAGPLVLYAETNEVGMPRLGLVVSRKQGGAVARNRWKRRLREAFRLEKHNMPQDIDLVVLPRQSKVANLDAVRRSMAIAAKRLRQKL